MTRCARRFSAAAVVAGFGLMAVIARAADFQNNSPVKSGSGVVLVSASDECANWDERIARGTAR